MADIIGTNSNDTLVGSNEDDTIKGFAGNDTITSSYGYDTLTGGGGKDKFVYDHIGYNGDTITDFGGVGKGTHPAAAVIAEVDTLTFQYDDSYTAQNLLLTQNGNNLEISFVGVYDYDAPLILQNFALENLDNLSLSTGASVDLGNIIFDGQTSITDSFDVFNANSTQSTIFNKNTVTFLNDLNNNVNGFDNSDDLINGQGGDDIIEGLSGNDFLRGGVGNDSLLGGAGNDSLLGGRGSELFTPSDSLVGGAGNDSLLGGTGNDYLDVDFSTGNNTLNGGVGDDTLIAIGSSAKNLLFGDDGNDYLDISYFSSDGGGGSSGNNTLNGGIGNDTLNASGSSGDNLLSGGDGNDALNISGAYGYSSITTSTGKNTLNGGAGNDTLSAGGSTGNNLLSGGDGNDFLDISGSSYSGDYSYSDSQTSGNNTLNGGIGNDTLTASGSTGNNLLSGGDGNDFLDLSNSSGKNTLNGGDGDDILTGGDGDDILTGGGGKDKFVYNLGENNNIITDFGGVGKGTNPTAAVIAEVDTLTFQGDGLTAQNLLLTKNGNNLEISFEGVDGAPVILQNFALENLDNLSLSTGASVDLGNILFDGQTSITDSFDVFNANSTQSTIFNKNTVTFLNDLSNNVNGFDNSDDVINGQGGDDIIDGKSGNDLLRGGTGNDTLIDGGVGNNLLSGGDGNDSLDVSGEVIYGGSFTADYASKGNNTLSGGAGNDTLIAGGSDGNNLLLGGDGNDYLSVFGDISYDYESGTAFDSSTSGNNTLNGGAGNDTLNASGSTGSNLLSGGDGNDYLKGGNGNDNLTGGNGIDTFAFNSYNEGVDSLYDFDATKDLIQVFADDFGGGLSTPSLLASQFTIGTSATTSEQRFIYNSATGALLFDQDGSASGFTQVKFAQLSTGLTLTENNFVVV